MGEPDQVTRSLPPPSFTPPKGTQPHTSAYLWEGNRLVPLDSHDPHSGTPAYKSIPVMVSKLDDPAVHAG